MPYKALWGFKGVTIPTYKQNASEGHTMSNYDNWLTTTPEDEEHAEQDRQDAAQARIERIIDGMPATGSHGLRNAIEVIRYKSRDWEVIRRGDWGIRCHAGVGSTYKQITIPTDDMPEGGRWIIGSQLTH
jgi:hypothetical protein